MKREIKIFTSADDGHVPVDTETLGTLEGIEMTEMLVRKYVRNKLLEESSLVFYIDSDGDGYGSWEVYGLY